MESIVTLHQPTQTDNSVAPALQRVLSGTYGLYLATHNYHWNVEGARFASLHLLFEGQYNELFKAVDTIAERIRAIGAYALPFEEGNITQISEMTSNPLNKETDADERADRMINNLLALNEEVVKTCQAAKEAALNDHDDESDNLMVERITAHQKAMWMLRSSLR